jgi:hypothetical protein
VTALRSFLRYLLHQGLIIVELAGCLPAVGDVRKFVGN